MRDRPLAIRHGTLVTPYGLQQADIWIKRDRIDRLAGKPLEYIDVMRGHLEEFDASDYYILPGFVGFLSKQASHYHSTESFLEDVKTMVQRGITCLVDTIRPSVWMNGSQMMYQMTPHFNNPIDYTVRISMGTDSFTPLKVRQVRDQGFRLLEIVVKNADDMRKIEWDNLYPILNQNKIAVHLHIPKDQGTIEDRKQIVESWRSDCIYGKVRTLIEEVDPCVYREEDQFYQISSLGKESLSHVVKYLQHHWYSYLPVVCHLNQFRLPLKQREMNPEVLLSIIVRMCSANVAKAIGCYPQKGSLLPGADADIVFVKKESWLTNFDLSTILNLSEIFLPNYVMSKGNWISSLDQYTPIIGKGRYIQKLKPYNYSI